MYKLYPFFAIVCLFLLSCSKASIESTSEYPSLIARWENPLYKNDTISFTKATDKKVYEYFIQFKADGSLIERENPGWCGTPPVSYSNYDGTWTIKDSIMQVSVKSWSDGGQLERKWKLLSVDNTKLRILRLQEEYK